MKLYFNQLEGRLKKTLDPVYLISGVEPLQRTEAADMIREAARERGFTSRELFFADPGFEWGRIRTAADNLSLFSDKKLLEIVMSGDRLKAEGAEFLQIFAEAPPPDTTMIIRADKVDARTAWVKKVTANGAFIQVYDKNAKELQAWARERMLKSDLKMEEGVVELMVERVEGNMLAAAQEIEKLMLSCRDETVSRRQVEKFVGVSSRFSVYDLANAACAGDLRRAVQVMRMLKIEGTAMTLVLWALAAQIRKIAALEKRRIAGERPDTLLKGEWRERKEVLRRALGRKLGARWNNMLYRCGMVDKAAKGAGGDDQWDELLKLILMLCALPTLRAGA